MNNNPPYNIQIHEDAVVSSEYKEDGIIYTVNFDVHLGDLFVDEFNNQYKWHSANQIKWYLGEKRQDHPKKFAYMRNMFSIQ